LTLAAWRYGLERLPQTGWIGDELRTLFERTTPEQREARRAVSRARPTSTWSRSHASGWSPPRNSASRADHELEVRACRPRGGPSRRTSPGARRATASSLPSR
jgi:hypothetical protein